MSAPKRRLAEALLPSARAQPYGKADSDPPPSQCCLIDALAAEVGEDAGGGGGGGGRCAEALADEVIAPELGLARRAWSFPPT